MSPFIKYSRKFVLLEHTANAERRKYLIVLYLENISKYLIYSIQKERTCLYLGK